MVSLLPRRLCRAFSLLSSLQIAEIIMVMSARTPHPPDPPLFSNSVTLFSPSHQKLASSALVWVMSAALEEKKDSSGSVGPTKDLLDVGPLLGLLGQAGEGGGDSGASDAVCLVLTGLAVNYPLLVVPKVGLCGPRAARARGCCCCCNRFLRSVPQVCWKYNWRRKRESVSLVALLISPPPPSAFVVPRLAGDHDLDL